MSTAQLWNVATVKELFEVKYGKANPGRSGDVPVIGSSGTYAWTDAPLVHEPTIVVGRKGSAGQVWYIERPCFPSDTTFYLIRRAEVDIDPEFAAYALRAHEVGASNDVIPSLQRHELENCEIPFPDPIEQRAIARILRNIEKATKVEAVICDKLAALKSATMAKLFREGLRGEPLKQTEIGEIPESWDVVRLGDRCKLRSGGTPSRGVPEYWGGDVPWVKTTEINYRVITDTEEKITEAGLMNSSAKIFNQGTLLMAMYGQGVTRGRVALLGIPAATNQACAAFFPDESISNGYLYAYFTHAYEQVRELGHGANQRNLSLELLEDVKIPVPKTIEEQNEISQCVMHLQGRLELSEERVATLNQLFSATLHALMTGAIRVKDLDLAEVSHA